MTTFDLSRTPPRGSGSPVGWGRGDEPIGPGNWRGPSGPPDNRPHTIHGMPSKGLLRRLFGCGLLLVLGLAGVLGAIGGAVVAVIAS